MPSGLASSLRRSDTWCVGQGPHHANTKEEDPMAVGIYLRVSTEEQRERQSIETQREFVERYCALHNLPIHRFYADEGISGTVPVALRPEARRLIEDARLHRFGQLLVY